MYRLLIIAILFVSFAMNGQTKTKTKTKTKVAKVDSTGAEIEEEKTPEQLFQLYCCQNSMAFCWIKFRF